MTTEFVLDENTAYTRILGEVRSDGGERLYALGSVRNLTSAGDAWGELQDSASGLVYLRARRYHPGLGLAASVLCR